MSRLFASLMVAVWRLTIIAAAVVMALLLFLLVVALMSVWLVRLGWARLTGRPVAAWAMPFNATHRFRQAYRAPGDWANRRPGRGAAQDIDGARRHAAEVTDVQVVREISRDDPPGS